MSVRTTDKGCLPARVGWVRTDPLRSEREKQWVPGLTLAGSRRFHRYPGPSVFEFRDGPRDECGVFGIHAPGSDVARLTYFALYALQHRGQESAGIAVAQGGHIMAMRDKGLVNQVFDEQKLRALRGDMAVGHVRYSTTGANSWENTQPVWRADRREVALAHNGNLVNAVELHGELRAAGVTFRSTSDSEIIAALLSTHAAERIEDAVADVIGRLEGAYSTVGHDQGPRRRVPRSGRHAPALARDARATRYCVASETCAFDIIGARFLRDVQPGEVVSLSARGIETRMAVEGARRALCVFEHIYFARPDSRLGGQVLQVSRGRMGEILAREAPVEADLVIAVPDSGNAAARGYARASGLPQDDGFVKNRYVARTFIQPGQELRKHGLRMKFNPLPEVVAGKRLVVVDDSIVRGNTTRQIVQMLRDAGASEVHMRISAPPIRHPCHYGIDMSTREEMIAHGRTEAEVAAELGADSLAYLSLGGRLRGDRRHARHALRRLLLRRVPAGEHGRVAGQGRVRAAAGSGVAGSPRVNAVAVGPVVAVPRRTSQPRATASRSLDLAVAVSAALARHGVEERLEHAQVLLHVGRRVRERRRRAGARDRVPDAAVGHVAAGACRSARRRASAPRRARRAAAPAPGSSRSGRRAGAPARAGRRAPRRPRSRRRAARRAPRRARTPPASGCRRSVATAAASESGLA